MKTTFLKFVLSIVIFCGAFTACESALEIEPKFKEDYLSSNKTPEYYQALREYKKSDHSIAFGWYGNWSGIGAGLSNCMAGIPDSVDVVSIWGNWRNITPEQDADLRYCQTVKGTKFLLCFIIHDLGDQLTPSGQTVQEYWEWEGEFRPSGPYRPYQPVNIDVTEKQEAAIRKYAKQIVDTIHKYNYDGFDFDFEPNFLGRWGSIANYPKRVSILIDEFSKYLGPKSGTDKLLVLDGEPQSMPPERGDCMDYFIVQAYSSRGYSDLDNRLNSTINNFRGVLEPEEVAKKYVVTENFESHSATGGVRHQLRDGTYVQSLEGMARWEPIINGKPTRKGGIGTYHMEYEFTIPSLPGTYPYLRKGIQIMNPTIE